MAKKKHEEKTPEKKKPVAYVYVGNENRIEVKIGKEKTLILWRNAVYRNLPECKEIEELIKKGDLKPIYT